MLKGLDPEEYHIEEQKQIEKRLCLDMEDAKDFLKVKYSYTDKLHRGFFAITAVLCEDPAEGCTDDQQNIKNLLDEMMFNMYIFEEEISFGDVHNIGKRPVKSQDILK